MKVKDVMHKGVDWVSPDTPITGRTPLLQVDNQFGREAIFRLQPVLLCVPSQKACCDTSGSCSAANCAPNPVPA